MLYISDLKLLLQSSRNASPTNASDMPMKKYACKLIIIPMLCYFTTGVGDFMAVANISDLEINPQSTKIHLYAFNLIPKLILNILGNLLVNLGLS